MTDNFSIQILKILQNIASHYHEEADITFVNKIRITFHIRQDKIDTLADIHYASSTNFIFFLLLSAYFHNESLSDFFQNLNEILLKTEGFIYKGTDMEERMKYLLHHEDTSMY